MGILRKTAIGGASLLGLATVFGGEGTDETKRPTKAGGGEVVLAQADSPEGDTGFGGAVVRRGWNFLKGAWDEAGAIFGEETEELTVEEFADAVNNGAISAGEKGQRFLDQILKNQGIEEGATVEGSVDAAAAVFAWGGEKALRALNRAAEKAGVDTSALEQFTQDACSYKPGGAAPSDPDCFEGPAP